MLNLVSFETPPLERQEGSSNTTITATMAIRGKEERSSNTCFHGHLDLSLGISLSHGGGSSGCDTSSCGRYEQESYDGRRANRDNKDDVRCITTAATTAANVITAGHGHDSDLTATVGGGWAAAAFMPIPTGFMHPWSLAARQQKAAAEQDRTGPLTTYMSSDDRVATSPSAVGWPPVHTSRRNIVTAMQVTKPAGANPDRPKSTTRTTTTHAGAGGEKNVAAPPPTDSTVVATLRPPPANMFAKVHMEGYAIGRKINLRAQGGYDSLSRVLTNMTTNFFCPADCSGAGTEEIDLPNTDKFIFLYEDFEGDRMLVGDVPWELFLASAKRLYIVRNPASSDKGQGEGDRKYKTEELNQQMTEGMHFSSN